MANALGGAKIIPQSIGWGKSLIKALAASGDIACGTLLNWESSEEGKGFWGPCQKFWEGFQNTLWQIVFHAGR